MALIKTTAIVDAISGKLQGTVFAKNKGGDYMRGRGKVLQPDTPAQMAARGLFGAISAAFALLLRSQIEQWKDFATLHPYTNRLGDQRVLTAKAMFQKVNTNLALANAQTAGAITTLDVPPVWLGVPFIDADSVLARYPFTIDANEPASSTGEVNIQYDSRVGTSDIKMLIYATPVLPVTVNNTKNKMRLLKIMDFPQSDTIKAEDFAQEYVDAFGSGEGTEQAQIKVRFINSETGEASVETTLSVNFS